MTAVKSSHQLHVRLVSLFSYSRARALQSRSEIGDLKKERETETEAKGDKATGEQKEYSNMCT